MRLNKWIYFISVMILAASCKKNLDINTDPNNPTDVAVSKLLPTAERGIGDALAIGNGTAGGLSEILSDYMHQTSIVELGTYGVAGSNFYIATAWVGLYQTTLTNLEKIIGKATADDDAQYLGIAKILKAYTYSQLVDVFGDVPFSEASKLDSGITYPKFDKDADIYPQLFALLDEGIIDLNNTSAANNFTPAGDDVIYGGNIALWIKAANTIKLKLYTQLRLVQDVKSEVNALLNSGNIISATDESFLLPYGTNGATDDRNPAFGDYFATQRTHYISPWFYEILKGYNSNINTGITDPRIPYYFYDEITKTEAADNPTEYRDSAFVSVYFGSVGVNRAQAQQNSMTVLGIYPAGGKYDVGDGSSVSGSDGTGAAPYRFITYADVLYLEAELIHEGITTGNEKTVLTEAMQESFKQVDYVVNSFVHSPQPVPQLAGASATTNYINAILAKYDAGNAAKKLEIIMTQKWISSFGSSVDQYTDYRRTGYPVLFDPKNQQMAPGGFVQPPVNGNPFVVPQAAVPVTVSVGYPESLPWYQVEIETNPNAPAQKTNLSTSKIFWMP